MMIFALTAGLDVPVADHVDVISVLNRAGKELMAVTGEFVGALCALDLRPDALLLRRGEAACADLLALVDVLSGHVLRELIGRGDRARDDCLAGDGLLFQHFLVDNVRARCASRDVTGGDEHRHLALAVLDVALVVDDIHARQNGG